jgi:peptidoglycan hydrolase-like protein with peptidoglycan-binding domain
VVLAAAVVAVFALLTSPGSSSNIHDQIPVVSVVRRDLVTRESFPGSLGYADPRPVVNRFAGTIIALPSEGAVVRRSDVLYRIDRLPVALLYGDVPAWRALAPGVQPGPDVRQLKRNLKALGFARRTGIAVDDRYDGATAAGVAAWQRSIGAPATSSLPLGSVVFLPGPRRIGAVRAGLGVPSRNGSIVLSTSSLIREATIRLPATEQTLAKLGEGVSVALPTGQVVSGHIAQVGTVATALQGQPPSIVVRISVGGAAVAALDQAPITVSLEAERKRGAIAVPVQALLALQGGGYALEVVGKRGERRLVRVRLGTFADGYVAVSGDGIRVGVRVSSAE